jgi:hypothetical protein
LSEYVKKTALGYKAVQGGCSDPECSHVILSKREYDVMMRENQRLEREVSDTKQKAAASIRQAQTEANRQVFQAQEKSDAAIQKMVEEVERANAERDYQISLNRNLLRINKEKSNAERKLRPKKEHTGYVVVSSQEKEVRYKSGKKLIPMVVWETVLQSPYSIDFPEEQARNQIHNELLTNDGGWKLGDIGINSSYMVGFDEMVGKLGQEIYNKNRAFSERLRVNYKAGYWEYIVLHTLPLEQVPKNMLP